MVVLWGKKPVKNGPLRRIRSRGFESPTGSLVTITEHEACWHVQSRRLHCPVGYSPPSVASGPAAKGFIRTWDDGEAVWLRRRSSWWCHERRSCGQNDRQTSASARVGAQHRFMDNLGSNHHVRSRLLAPPVERVLLQHHVYVQAHDRPHVARKAVRHLLFVQLRQVRAHAPGGKVDDGRERSQAFSASGSFW